MLSDRQTQILESAKRSGRVSVEELAARYDVSVQTIRKDLNDLCDQRLLARVHGGAVLSSGVENVGYDAPAPSRRTRRARSAGRLPISYRTAPRSSSISAPRPRPSPAPCCAMPG